MYRNSGTQAKRLARKVSEACFDLEVIRHFMQAENADDLATWEEVAMDLDEIMSDLTIAKDLVANAIKEIGSDEYGGIGKPPEQVNNPFAKKPNGETPPPAPTAPEAKKKGG